MATYRHGAFVDEQATSLVPPVEVASALPFVVGTAPVHRLKDKAAPINEPRLTAFSYTDNATEKADEVQLELQDREGAWHSDWWPAKGTSVVAGLVCSDWFGAGRGGRLDCGSFTVDEVKYEGPPDKLTIKAVSASLNSELRDTTRTKGWENYTFRDLAAEIAAKNGLKLAYTGDPCPFTRIDQREESDLAFLQRLATERGANLKVHDGTIYLFSAKLGDAQSASLTIRRSGDAFSPERFSFEEKSDDTDYSECSVSYRDPESGEVNKATFSPEGGGQAGEKPLTINQRVESLEAALRLGKAQLRQSNKVGSEGTVDIPGHPDARAGRTVALTGFGKFDGTWFVETSKHSLGDGGYRTSLTIRRTLGY